MNKRNNGGMMIERRKEHNDISFPFIVRIVNEQMFEHFIAHRLNTVKSCDYIYVMDKGSICECGTHQINLSFA